MEFKLKNIVLLLIAFCVIVLFIILIMDGNKKKTINYDNIKSSKNNYEEYNIDDLVKLKNDSEWYVLRENTKKDKEVYLLSKNKINNEPISNISSYIKNEYYDSLCNSLFISRDEITDIRLLNSSDICNLYNTDCYSFNIKFDTSKYKLLENASLVDYEVDNKKLSLCSEGFCNNDNTDIRVVIEIPKFFIKNDIEKED